MSAQDDPFDFDDDPEVFGSGHEAETGRSDRRSQKSLSDFVKRAIDNTLGSVQSTGSLSREALQFLITQGDRGRKEATRLVAKEVRDFLDHIELSREITEVLRGLTVDVSASIRFRKTEDGGLRPDVKVSGPKARGPSEVGTEDLKEPSRDLPARDSNEN
jgi:hypothetical protein